MNHFSIQPHVGFGPITLGTSRSEIAALMATLGFVRHASRGRSDYYFRAALQIEFGPDDIADFIGISQSELYRAEYFGTNVFDVPANKLVAIIAAKDGSGPREFDPDEADEYFPGQIMTLWGADRQYDYLGGEKRLVWAQVGLGSPRYAKEVRFS